MNGIYAWKCIINNKYYIGQARNLSKRPYDHFKYPNQHGVKFENAIKKHGKENFKLIILDTNCSNLDNMEKLFIKTYNSKFAGYNSTFGGSLEYSTNGRSIYSLWDNLKVHYIKNKKINRIKPFALKVNGKNLNLGQYFIDFTTIEIIHDLIEKCI
jgi:group I intron endonuclease